MSMKKNNLKYRNQIIYQVFPRNFSKEGTFSEIIKKLPDIKKLGTDILYLMPINEIGVICRKGVLGSPYSIKDYYEINKEYGDLEDLKRLISATHDQKMKIIIDIVFNHTSRDSVLTKKHPEWFVHNELGNFTNRFGDWSDITDFTYANDEIIKYLTDVLCYYLKLGIDGFRFDVCSVLPEKFYEYCLPILKKLNKNIIMIGESVHPDFRKHILDLGYDVLDEASLYNYFDILYDYDVFPAFQKAMHGEITLSNYMDKIIEQEQKLPMGYVKLRYIEKHDMPRIMSYFKNKEASFCGIALIYMLRGMTFLYNGIETLSDHQISLFDKDDIEWDKKEEDVVSFISKLSLLKKDNIYQTGIFNVINLDDVFILIKWSNEEKDLYAFLNLKGIEKNLDIDFLSDGEYQNLLGFENVIIQNKKYKTIRYPQIIEIKNS